MNGLEKPYRKNPIQKNRKTVKNQSEIAACEQKKHWQESNFHAAKPLGFLLYVLLRHDQNHYSNMTSKIMKMCEQILKKHSRKNSGNDSKEKIVHSYD